MLFQTIKTFIKQYTSILAVRNGYISKQLAANDGRIIILMYHKITPERDVLGLSISPFYFQQQLAFLKSRFNIISLEEAVTMLATGTISGEYAVLTFDDGYRDNYIHAYKILREYCVPATIFVTVEGLETGYFGWYTFDQAILVSKLKSIDLTEYSLGIIDIRTRAKKIQAIYYLHHELKEYDHDKCISVLRKVTSELAPGANSQRIMLTWNEAKEMQASGLVTIGSHTMTHPILTRINREIARSEIVRSKAIIEEKLGSPVELFAYPNGKEVNFDDDIIMMLKNAGYSSACTTISGSVRSGEDIFRLPRIDVTFGMCEGIGGTFSPEMFEMALSR